MLLQVASPLLQTALFAAALLAFLIAHTSWRPYQARTFYLAELASMICLMLTANLATVATSGPSALVDLSPSSQDGCAIIMIILNFATVLGLAALYGRTCIAARCTAARRRAVAIRCVACLRGRRGAARAAFAVPAPEHLSVADDALELTATGPMAAGAPSAQPLSGSLAVTASAMMPAAARQATGSVTAVPPGPAVGAGRGRFNPVPIA